MRAWVDRGVPWALRVAWAAVPLSLGPALGDALDAWAAAPRSAATALLWLGWAAVAAASCVALPATLAITRVGLAAAVVAGAAALTPWAAVAALAAAIGARPEAAEWFVNGPAYVNERRYPLRVPAALAAGPLWVAAALSVATPAAGVVLLADGRYTLGGVVLAAGMAVGFVGGRAVYGLTRRWVVFVPAGLVLHDPLTLTDPVLFERKLIESLRPAVEGTDSLDLTQSAFGLPLELVLTEKVPMVLSRGRGSAESGASARLLFSPTRPGRVLQEAAARRFPVG